jgi:hypothetical protein
MVEPPLSLCRQATFSDVDQQSRVTFLGSDSAPPVPSSHTFGCRPATSREISWLSLHSRAGTSYQRASGRRVTLNG